MLDKVVSGQAAITTEYSLVFFNRFNCLITFRFFLLLYCFVRIYKLSSTSFFFAVLLFCWIMFLWFFWSTIIFHFLLGFYDFIILILDYFSLIMRYFFCRIVCFVISIITRIIIVIYLTIAYLVLEYADLFISWFSLLIEQSLSFFRVSSRLPYNLHWVDMSKLKTW